ncbi:MAG: hypothetical protein A2V98_05535 [Planctomycetes bacterium RBG_16_64_12]|nr:MAG: hypothetical protein A2V98_05535 [Planctomycetes bacterium RBG_16_64_12]
MILRSIRVEGWRCFVAPTELGPFIDGLNIIHGPNGSGKSTLMMALVRGLFDGHMVTGAEIKALRPWGRALNPRVAIEFEQDGVQYRLHKQFLSSQTAQLNRMENGAYVPVAESRAADEQARQLLSSETPGRGASDQRHWGLAQILWATQGNLRIDHLSGGTRATIQDALGAQVSGPGAEALEKRIADAYGQFFTATGKLKGGASAPAVVGLKDKLEREGHRRDNLLTRLEEFDDASRRIEDLRRQTELARHSEEELNEKLKQAREQAQVYKDLIGRQKLHQQEVKAAEESYRNSKERIDAIRSARQERHAVTEQLKRLQDDTPAQAKLIEQCQEQAEKAKKSVEQVRARRGEVTAARQLARLAERFSRTQETLGELDELLERIESAQQVLEKLRTSCDQVVAPDAETLAKIKKTAWTRDKARLQLDAALITVNILPEVDTQVEITTAEETGQKTLAARRSHRIQGAPEVAFQIPGVGRFQATGPTGSVDELREEWEKAVARLEELTAGYGSNDVDRLEKLHTQAAEMEGRISRAEVRIHTLLGGRQSDELRAERTRAASTIKEILAARGEWEDARPDPDKLAQQADELEQRFTADIDGAEAENDRAQNALNRALQKQTSHDAEVKSAKNQIVAIEKRLESLCNDGLDDAQRAAKLTTIAIQQDAAQAKFARVDAQVKEFGDDPAKSVTVLEGQRSAVRDQTAEAEENLNTEKGRLEQITSEAPYSGLATVEEEIHRLEDEIARQQLQINAIRLLYETLRQRKREVMQLVMGPVRLRANQTFQRIAGTRLQDIHFGDSLLPIGVAPRALDEPVSLDEISGGEQEQLYFAVRLALADVAFGGERQLVVLDDVFTYTDTARLARIATILDEAAERFQMVLLTCHPERYRGLPRANFFDLEKIATRASEQQASSL